MVATSQEYRVDLDIYNGPLDLLLYLIRREEIDIYDIPIARITGQYMQYMEVLKAMDLGVVGDFLVMAATLMEIKSRLLLPAQEDGEEGEEEDDPRMELVRQLIEYKRFKDAAAALSMWGKEQDRRFARPGELDAFGAAGEPQDFEEEFELWHLVEAFAKLMQQTGMGVEGTVVYDDTPIHEYMRIIMDLLEKHTIMSFFELFALHRGKSAMIGCFLALLELVKQRHVRVEQVSEHGDIILAIRRPDQEGAPKGTVREFIALPLKGTSRRVRLQRPMATAAYQRRARRQVATVPARRRAYRSCIVSMATEPALKLQVTASRPSPATQKAVPPRPETTGPLISDDIEEVEVIDVREVEFDAPDGWEPPPPIEPERLALRRPLARGAGRCLFVPRRPRRYGVDRPRRKSPLTAPIGAPPLADEPTATPLPTLAAPQPILPAPPALAATTVGDAEAQRAPLPRVHRSLARGKGRKLFRPEYPRTRRFRPPWVASQPVTHPPPALADLTAPATQVEPLVAPPAPVLGTLPLVQAETPTAAALAPPLTGAPSRPVAEVDGLPVNAQVLADSAAHSSVPAPSAPKIATLSAPSSEAIREGGGSVFRPYARARGRKRCHPLPRAYRPQLPRVRHLVQPEPAEPEPSATPTSGEREHSWLMAIWIAIKRFAAMLWRYVRGFVARWTGPRD